MSKKHNAQKVAHAISGVRPSYLGFVPMAKVGARRCDYSGVCSKPATYTMAGQSQIGICDAHAAVVGARLRIA